MFLIRGDFFPGRFCPGDIMCRGDYVWGDYVRFCSGEILGAGRFCTGEIMGGNPQGLVMEF